MDKNVYSGISFPFRFNSQGRVEKSKLTVNDYSRIRESIIQIIFTYRLERVMTPDFGMDRSFLFSSIDDETEQAIFKHEIEKVISEEEPRVIINSCEVYPCPEKESTLIVDLDLHIIKFVRDVDMQVSIDSDGRIGEV